jgi:hypothetical protein
MPSLQERTREEVTPTSLQERTRDDGTVELHLWFGDHEPSLSGAQRVQDGHRRHRDQLTASPHDPGLEPSDRDPPPDNGNGVRRRWDGDIEEPDTDRAPRFRRRDATANAPEEMIPGRSPPGGGPYDPDELGGEDNGEEARTSGGLPVARLDQTAEPPVFVDTRSLRVRGRDQNGKLFEAAVWGPNGQGQPWNRIGDQRAGLLVGYADDHIRALGTYQRLLNAHYARR